MAQRTGAKRFLVASRKAASAGIVPVLAVVLIGGLAGCGGGSSAATTTKSTPTSASAAPPGSNEAEVGDSGGEGVPESRNAAEAEGRRSSANEGSGSVGGGKQGAKIVPPKGPREAEPTHKEIAEATVADIALASPSLPSAAGGVAPLTAAYTCDGKDSWPDLAWQGVPEGTAELALFAMNVQPVAGKLFFDWAVAGIDPGLTGINTSRLPRGAVTGQNSLGTHGYSICPDPGTSETYMFALYAIPQRLSPRQDFDPGTFRQQVLATSGNAGFLPVSYARG